MTPVDPVAPGAQLVIAALLGIAVIVVLITVTKLHPFLALILGGATVGSVAGLAPLDTLIGPASPRTMPWAMAGVGAIIGLPMFFEIGLVLLMPVIYLAAASGW